MSKKRHKILAKIQQGHPVVRVLIQHPMETGNRKDKLTGAKIPRHFIREIHCLYNGRQVMSGHWSWGMAVNPYLAFHLASGQKGDHVRIDWTDNQGGSDSIETRVR